MDQEIALQYCARALTMRGTRAPFMMTLNTFQKLLSPDSHRFPLYSPACQARTTPYKYVISKWLAIDFKVINIYD